MIHYNDKSNEGRRGHLQNECYGLSFIMNTRRGEMGREHVQTKGVGVGEPVWVQCEGFRCLAYLNHKGEWRVYSDNAKLPDTVKVLSMPPGSRERL